MPLVPNEIGDRAEELVTGAGHGIHPDRERAPGQHRDGRREARRQPARERHQGTPPSPSRFKPFREFGLERRAGIGFAGLAD